MKKIVKYLCVSLLVLSFLTGCSPTEEPIDPAKQQQEEQKKKEQEEKEKKEKEEQEKKKQEEEEKKKKEAEEKKKQEEEARKKQEAKQKVKDVEVVITFQYIDVDTKQPISKEVSYPTYQYVEEVENDFIALYKGDITVDKDLYVLIDCSNYELFDRNSFSSYLENPNENVITLYYKKFVIPEKFKDIVGKWYCPNWFGEIEFKANGKGIVYSYVGDEDVFSYYFEGENLVVLGFVYKPYDKPYTVYKDTHLSIKDGVMQINIYSDNNEIQYFFDFDKYCPPISDTKKYNWLWGACYNDDTTLVFTLPGLEVPNNCILIIQDNDDSTFEGGSYIIDDEHIIINTFSNNGVSQVEYTYSYDNDKIVFTDSNNNSTTYTKHR